MKLYFIVLGSSIGRGKRDAALLVEHAVLVVGPLAPDLLVAPVGRGLHRLGGGEAWNGGPNDSGAFGSATGILKNVTV